MSTTVRVIYGDTDQMGIVYYANYLRYFEIGRAEWLRARGYDYRRFEASGFLLPVIEAHVRYRSPARYDDVIDIGTETADIKSASLRFVHRLERAGESRTLIAEGYTLHACVDRSGRPRRFPPEALALLRRTPALE